MNEQIIHAVRVEVAAAYLPILTELIAVEELNSASWSNMETGEAYVRVFADSARKAEMLESLFRERLMHNWQSLLPEHSANITISCQTLKQEDWSESWKRHFHTFRASPHLVIKPSWEQFTPAEDDIVLELDPGMCFGTGYHGTTLACLRFLDDLRQQFGAVPLLDAGCGSGILAVAAAKLGFRPITAFDHDPEAVKVTRENLVRNGITDVDIHCVDLTQVTEQESFQVVIANVLAHVLQSNVEKLTRLTATGGALVLSGILTEQYDEILRTYQSAGFQEERRLTLAEWTSGCFLKNM